MAENPRSVPQWKAPDTLFPAVMRAVQCQAAPARGFYTWSLGLRVVFSVGAAVALVLAAAVALPAGSLVDSSTLLERFASGYEHFYRAALVLLDAGGVLLSPLATSPLGLLLAAGLGGTMMATWVASVLGLQHALGLQHHRRQYA
jgi:hypothetical protein